MQLISLNKLLTKHKSLSERPFSSGNGQLPLSRFLYCLQHKIFLVAVQGTSQNIANTSHLSYGDVLRYLLPIRVHAIKYHSPDICLNKFISLRTNFSFKREEDIHSRNKKFLNFLCVQKYLYLAFILKKKTILNLYSKFGHVCFLLNILFNEQIMENGTRPSPFRLKCEG